MKVCQINIWRLLCQMNYQKLEKWIFEDFKWKFVKWIFKDYYKKS